MDVPFFSYVNDILFDDELNESSISLYQFAVYIRSVSYEHNVEHESITYNISCSLQYDETFAFLVFTS